MTNRQKTRGPQDTISLHHGDNRLVDVTAPENDRFLLEAPMAVAACQMLTTFNTALTSAQHDFDMLKRHLEQWGRNHDLVSRIVLQQNMAAMATVVLVVTEGGQYLHALDDAVSALEIELHSSFPTMRLVTRTIPAKSFVSLAASGAKSCGEVYVKRVEATSR